MMLHACAAFESVMKSNADPVLNTALNMKTPHPKMKNTMCTKAPQNTQPTL